MPLVDQKDTTVPAGPLRTVCFFKTQEAGEPSQFHLLICDTHEGKLMKATLERDQAIQLAETIRAATGP